MVTKEERRIRNMTHVYEIMLGKKKAWMSSWITRRIYKANLVDMNYSVIRDFKPSGRYILTLKLNPVTYGKPRWTRTYVVLYPNEEGENNG